MAGYVAQYRPITPTERFDWRELPQLTQIRAACIVSLSGAEQL